MRRADLIPPCSPRSSSVRPCEIPFRTYDFDIKHIIRVCFLSLPRSRTRPAGPARADSAIRLLVIVKHRYHLTRISREILHGDKRFSSSVSSRSAGLDLLAVGREVEGNEEDEVGGEDGHASESSEFLTSADTSVRHRGEVDIGEVGVGGEVDEAEVDYELNDLQHGDVFLPPNANAAGRLEVVPRKVSLDKEVVW
jgi:hypothetical protein